jgi:hypothetical protein
VIVISGQTFAFRKKLGAAGASFNGAGRCWEMNAAATAEERGRQLRLANEMAAAGLQVEVKSYPLTGDLLT